MMHRRGGGKFRGGNRNFQGNFQSNNDRFQSEHDDRSGFKPSEIKRRVSFKNTVRNYKSVNSAVNDMKVKAFLEDEDMIGELAQGEGSQRLSGDFRRGGSNFRNRRKGSPIPRHAGGKLLQSPSGWYKIVINQGSRYDKDMIFKLLLNALSPTVFIPKYFTVEVNKSVSFFVDAYDVAEKISKLDRKIELPDGFKLVLRVIGSTPQVKIDNTLKERMKNAMVKRYNPATKALDLTKFDADTDLTDIFCGLFRPPILSAAIDIIAENIPDLEALNLNDNKIYLLDHLNMMVTKLPHLKILYLGNNKVFMLTALDSLRGLPLVELFLEGNPCKKRIKDHAHYVSEIKKRFPKLIKLDGTELGPTIEFDVADDAPSSVPQWKSTFLCNPTGSEFVQKFVHQYFTLYDSDNRQQLLEAYHEHAIWSITATNDQHATSEEKLYAYWKVGRNLNHPRGYENRLLTLKRGKLNVVALLTELPSTIHDLHSFAVDLTVFTQQMVVLTVSGLFKERSSNPRTEYTRTFQKTMVIVPNNGGFCIKNELMHVNNASHSQARNAFKAPLIASPQLNTSMTSGATSASPQQQAVPDEATKMQMIQMMSQQSNMNVEWSRKCLEETNWDYQQASYAFGQLFKHNKIPSEAFVK